MLLAESMFFTAFAALAIGSKSGLSILLGLAGLLLNVIWMIMTAMQLGYTTKPLRKKMHEIPEKDKTQFMNAYIEISKNRPAPKITDFIQIWIPVLLIIIWILLMVFYGFYSFHAQF
jgi:hypothetical protein